MRIVIDIPEETYKMCKRLWGDADEIERAIANGTVLPICYDCDLYECVTDNYCQYAGKCVPIHKCRYFILKEGK